MNDSPTNYPNYKHDDTPTLPSSKTTAEVRADKITAAGVRSAEVRAEKIKFDEAMDKGKRCEESVDMSYSHPDGLCSIPIGYCSHTKGQEPIIVQDSLEDKVESPPKKTSGIFSVGCTVKVLHDDVTGYQYEEGVVTDLGNKEAEVQMDKDNGKGSVTLCFALSDLALVTKLDENEDKSTALPTPIANPLMKPTDTITYFETKDGVCLGDDEHEGEADEYTRSRIFNALNNATIGTKGTQNDGTCEYCGKGRADRHPVTDDTDGWHKDTFTAEHVKRRKAEGEKRRSAEIERLAND